MGFIGLVIMVAPAIIATFRSHIRFFELEMALFHDAATYLSCID